MPVVRVGLWVWVLFAAAARAGEPVPLKGYDPPAGKIGYLAQLDPTPANGAAQVDEAPKPDTRHRKLKIVLGVVGGVVLIGAIVAVGVANASSGSSNQTGYNDWGTLVIMRR